MRANKPTAADPFFDWTNSNTKRDRLAQLRHREIGADGKERLTFDFGGFSEAQPPCLDRGAKSQKPPTDGLSRGGGQSLALGGTDTGSGTLPDTGLRTRIYQNGEIQHVSVLNNPRTAQPAPNFGPRMVRGVSRKGAKTIRRAVEAKVDSMGQPKARFYTFTCNWQPETDPVKQHEQDQAFRKKLNGLLDVWRKKHPESIGDYALTVDLQQRGVLHAHMLIFADVPRSIWLELRDMWAEKRYALRDPKNSNVIRTDSLGRQIFEAGYGMGPGSFDVKKLDHPRRAANYMARYITQATRKLTAVHLDFTMELPEDRAEWDRALEQRGGGTLCHSDAVVRVATTKADRKGRNGKEYVREGFRGNAYSLSRSLRTFAAHVYEALWRWRSPEARLMMQHCFRRDEWGGVVYKDSQAEALQFLKEVLDMALSPPSVVDAWERDRWLVEMHERIQAEKQAETVREFDGVFIEAWQRLEFFQSKFSQGVTA